MNDISFDINILSFNIRYYRIQNGLSQTELAEKLYLSSQSISKWETGVTVPDLENIYALSKLLNVSIDSLFEREHKDAQFMIGVDGGGTKTEFFLFDTSCEIFERVVLDGCNPNSCGIQQTFNILRTGIDFLMKGKSDVIGIYIGASGFASGDNSIKIKKLLEKQYPKIKFGCSTDVMNIIACAPKNEPCIATICGTGVVVCDYHDGVLTRYGGWGYILEKSGSGFNIGKDALCAALSENEGFGKHTVITDIIEKQLGCKVWEYISEIYKKDKSYIASFAKVVFDAYDKGDEVASEILNNNAESLAVLIGHAYKQNKNSAKTVLLSGGLFSDNDVYMKLLEKKVPKELKLQLLNKPQVFGACKMCCDMCGVDETALINNFGEVYKKSIIGGNI